MAGPVFCAFVRVMEGQDVVGVARAVSRIASTFGYGTLFGTDVIGCWDPQEKESLTELERRLATDLVVSITSHPLQTSASEIFNNELNPMAGSGAQNPSFFQFIREIVASLRITSATFVVAEDPWMSRNLPERQVTLEEFLSHLLRYHILQADAASEFGGDGIFHLQRKDSGSQLISTA